MKVSWIFIAGFIIVFMAVQHFGIGWPSDLDDQTDKVATFFQYRKVGSSVDMVLMKGGYPVAMVYGFASDYDTCLDLARALENMGGSYSCDFANH